MSEKRRQPTERIEKPWGYEILWAKTDHYVGKILFIRENHSISLQYHEEKDESMFLDSGECVFEAGDDESRLERFDLFAGDSFHIPPGLVHRISAKTDCRIFEVSTNHLTDVVRLKDNYGRV